jgi:arsenate reductase
LIVKLGLSPFEILRKGEPQAKELGLTAESPPGDIIKYIVQYPALLQRPIVEVGDKAILARPAEKALQLVR